MTFEGLDNEGDITRMESDTDEVGKSLVMDHRAASGFMQFPDDLKKHLANQGLENPPDTWSILTLEWSFMDGSTSEVWLDWVAAVDLFTTLTGWIKSLHESGNCGCGAHDKEEN